MRSRAMSRTWVEVDLDILLNNYRIARSFVKDTTAFIAVVKADAYAAQIKHRPD